MKACLACLIVVGAVAAGSIVALAGAPFGGNDTGFIPPDSPNGPVTKCEKRIGMRVSRLVAGILNCHVKEASGKLVGGSAEDACESKARTKFGRTKTTGCPPCIDLTTLGIAVEALVDSSDDVNSQIYCSSPGSAFGGDDTGLIPADAPTGPITKCENRIAKLVGRAAARIEKCHAGRAVGKLGTPDDEDICDDAATAKLVAANVSGCSCTDAFSIAASLGVMLDQHNHLIYCSSPSGAFLE